MSAKDKMGDGGCWCRFIEVISTSTTDTSLHMDLHRTE